MKKIKCAIAWTIARLIRSLLLISAYIVYTIEIVLIAVGILVTLVVVVVPVMLMVHGVDAAKRLSMYSLIQRMKRDFWEEPH